MSDDIIVGGSGTVTKLIAGAGISLSPPSGRGIVTVNGGGLVATDFLFNEGVDEGTYTALMPLPAGTHLCEIYLFALEYTWVASSAEINIGDTTDPTAFYPAFSLDAGSNFIQSYDPTAPGESGDGAGWSNIAYASGLSGASILQVAIGVPNPGSGVLYPTDDELSMVITTIVDDPPVVGTGSLLVRVLTIPPVTPTLVPLVV